MVVLRLLLLVSLTAGGGYQLCRRGLREDRIIIALPAGLVLGLNLWTAGLNWTGRWLPLGTAGWLTAVALGALALMLWWRSPATALKLGVPRGTASMLAATAMIIMALYGVLLAGNPDQLYDQHFHGPLVATLANGNLPPERPDAPGVALEYHYGADLFAAGLAEAGHIPPWQAELVAVLVNLTTAWLLVFGIGVILTGSRWVGWGATLIFFSGGAWVQSYRPNAVGLFDLLPQTVGGYGTQLLHLPTAMAAPLSLLTVYLFNHSRRRGQAITASLLLGFTLGHLGLLAEDRSVLLLATAAIIASSVCLRHGWRRAMAASTARWFLPTVAVAAILLISQGGVITENVRQSARGIAPLVATAKLTAPNFPYWDDHPPYVGAVPARSRQAWAFVGREFGLGILGAFGIGYGLRKKYLPRASGWIWLLTAATFSLALTPFIQFSFTDLLRTRLYGIFRDFGNVAAGGLFGWLIAAGATTMRRRVSRLAGVLVVTVLFSSGNVLFLTYQMTDSIHRLQHNILPAWLKPAEQAAAAIGRTFPVRSVVLTNQPITVGRLWGQFTAAADLTNKTTLYYPPINGAYLALLQNPSLDGISRLGITHIYVSPPPSDGPPLAAYREPMASTLYEQNPAFTLLYRSASPDGERRIYAFRPTPP